MKQKEWVILIILMIVIAAVVAYITGSITGNVVRAAYSGQQVYTKTDIDTRFKSCVVLEKQMISGKTYRGEWECYDATKWNVGSVLVGPRSCLFAKVLGSDKIIPCTRDIVAANADGAILGKYDLNGDNVIDQKDWNIVNNAVIGLGCITNPPQGDVAAKSCDLNGDRAINGIDSQLMANLVNTVPGKVQTLCC